MKLKYYNGEIGYQTIYILIKKTNTTVSSSAKKNVIGTARVLRLDSTRLISDRMDIDENHDCMDLKDGVGYWEDDTLHVQDGYFVTLTERVSKLLLTTLVKNKTTKAVIQAIKQILQPYKTNYKILYLITVASAPTTQVSLIIRL
ncbi:MAG: hypothetical protein QS748_05455 [Candidatus Endonucleobacter bathymodioli]|uniref:Uncharacterized protein n=1 Tax=Candidatus Endonucleibacter bathymodioli TaxID=539814 RepID=A0AA90SXG6_9GAMM|nr:hypothetical protein [Candidatus Endonucleobacter bathymodioli]